MPVLPVPEGLDERLDFGTASKIVSLSVNATDRGAAASPDKT